MWPGEETFSLNDGSPKTLFDSCMDVITDNLDAISIRRGGRVLLPHIVLPAIICDKFMEAYQRKYRLSDSVAHMFRDRKRTRLTQVKLQHANITDLGLRYLLAHGPREIQLIRCERLTEAVIPIITANSKNVVHLQFGPTDSTFNSTEPIKNKLMPVFDERTMLSLTINCQSEMILPITHIKSFSQITFLNLSSLPEEMRLSYLHHLKYLILHDVPLTSEAIHWIRNTSKNIEYLDISQENESQAIILNPSETLHNIVTSLPKLLFLDISGTNLAGPGRGQSMLIKENGEEVLLTSDIPGLISRANNPLEFLGLYRTHHGACNRHDIPARKISGDANEQQLLTAAQAAFKHPNMLTHVLNDLYYIFRVDNITNVGAALNLVLCSLEKYPLESQIQISGSAIIYYILKGNHKSRMGLQLKRRIITLLLDIMDSTIADHDLMRNGCLAICQFKIPEDVLFEYERIVQILLDVAEETEREYVFVQRIAIYLLNSLACQVEKRQKIFLGNKGAINVMLRVISQRLQRHVCDDAMEVAWSTLWNVTDETPINCQRFLDNRGMTYFLSCLRIFQHKEELVRNMMGLLGNVAEVRILRPRLMQPLIMSVFYNLLNSDTDGIEVSYNAAGIIAHIASDGPEAWTVPEPPRIAVLFRMSSAIHRWDRKAERNINYRSFLPILNLLKAHHTPQCQEWAVWALANLTTVYPEKYCKLLEREGGLDMLKVLLQPFYPYPYTRRLVRIVIKNCENFTNQEKPLEVDY